MILCINGVPVRKGQEVVSFRGKKGILKDWRLPHKESSTGRVYIQWQGQDGSEGEYYPGVIGAKWEKSI